MRVKTLRLPDDLSREIARRARMKGVPDADYYRLLIERGLLLEAVDRAQKKPVAPAYWPCARQCSRHEISCVLLPPRVTTGRSPKLRFRRATSCSR
jgi:hypothetical protein